MQILLALHGGGRCYCHAGDAFLLEINWLGKSLTGVPDIKDNAGRARAHKLTHAPHGTYFLSLPTRRKELQGA